MDNEQKSSGKGIFRVHRLKSVNFAVRFVFPCLLAGLVAIGRAFASDSSQFISQMAHASWGAKEGVVDVTSITQTQDGYLWVATAEGLFRFDGIDFTLWQPPSEGKGSESKVEVLCASRDGGLWMGSKTGANFLNNGILEHFTVTNGLPEGEVTSIVEDRSGAIWVATTKGLARFKGGDWTVFGVEAGLTEGRTRVELEDGKGNLWVAVDDPEIAGGTLLGCLRPGTNRFELARCPNPHHPIMIEKDGLGLHGERSDLGGRIFRSLKKWPDRLARLRDPQTSIGRFA